MQPALLLSDTTKCFQLKEYFFFHFLELSSEIKIPMHRMIQTTRQEVYINLLFQHHKCLGTMQCYTLKFRAKKSNWTILMFVMTQHTLIILMTVFLILWNMNYSASTPFTRLDLWMTQMMSR